MKTINYLFFLSLIFILSCSQYHSEELKEDNLKGKVKTIKSSRYEAIEKFGEVTKGEKIGANGFNTDDIFELNSLASYNENGELYEVSIFSNSGNLILKLLASNEEMKIYNKDGDLELLMDYDDKLKPIEMNMYSSNGDLIGKKKFKYDENNLLIEENTFKADGDIEESINFEYNVNSLKTKTTLTEFSYNYYGDKEKEEKITLYSYNEHNDILEKQVNKGSNSTNFSYKEYEYDKMGNWIKRIKYKNTKAIHIEEREISYY